MTDTSSDGANGKRALIREWENFLVSDKQSRMLRIMPGSHAAICRGCAGRIYRIVVNGKPVEADCDGPGGVHPSETQPGYGVSHVARCAARQVRREGRGR